MAGCRITGRVSSQPEPLLKAAILHRQLGNKKAAMDHLQHYLQLAPRDAPGRGTAEALLQQLDGPPSSARPSPLLPAGGTGATRPSGQAAGPADTTKLTAGASASETVQPVSTASRSSRWVGGWTAIGLGGAAVLGAGLLFWPAVNKPHSTTTSWPTANSMATASASTRLRPGKPASTASGPARSWQQASASQPSASACG